MDLYTAIVIITVALLGVTVVDIYTNRVIDNKMKQYSIIVCLLIAVSMFCEWAGVKTNGADVSLITVHKIVKLVEFCIAPLICAMAAFSYSRIKRPTPIAIVATAHMIFETVSLKFGLVIYVDEANLYHRGVLYPVYIAVFSASIIYCFIAIMRDEIKHYLKPTLLLMAVLGFLTIGIGMQMIFSDLRVDYMCVAMGNYFLYNHRCKMILQLDGLTHLLNRRCYEKDLEKVGPPTMIITMDVNRFKKINDTYGHAAGDFYLKEIAQIIRDTYEKFGACYRCGGDEFCILLYKSIDRTEELNELFQNRIMERQMSDSRFPGVSVGYALFDSSNGHGHIQHTIEKADEMMYNIKSEYKNANTPCGK